MNTKSKIAALAVAFLVAGGISLGTAGSASATEAVCTPAAAYDETVIDTPAVPEVPAVPAVTEQVLVSAEIPAVPATEAVTHTEYEFRQIITGKTKWETDQNWNAENNWHSLGWYFDGNTREVVDVPANPGSPAVPAVYQTVIITPEIPAVPAVDAVTHVVHHDAVECPETVTPPADTPQPPLDKLVTSKQLAFTGPTDNGLIPIGGLLLSLGVIAFLMKRRFV